MKPRVAVVDYGMGNLYSVQNALFSLGLEPCLVSRSFRVSSYDQLILPGVGAFGDAMQELRRRRLLGPLRAFIASGKPFLGICLGMQLLMQESQESPGVEGLGVVKGGVRRFPSSGKCPHMGWNQVDRTQGPLAIFKGLGRRAFFVYFCHSFYVMPKDGSVVIGRTPYGINFASVIQKGNVFGMQFHPEKSQAFGLKLLENFIRLC